MVALMKPDNQIVDTIIHGDALEVLRALDTCSVDAIVTDPPSAIHFMGKEWDSDKGGRTEWIGWLCGVMREALRVLKPGGHALIWALPRTSHWTATAIEDAGFEIRDVLTHLFGSGFPKSMDISKAIDRMAGAEREVVGRSQYASRRPNPMNGTTYNYNASQYDISANLDITAPSTPQAQQWQGYGTALKPASEHWILARKPLSEKSIAENVLRWGTGGLNIDQCRVGLEGIEHHRTAGSGAIGTQNGIYNSSNEPINRKQIARAEQGLNPRYDPQGRFPSNLLLSHSLFCVPLGEKRVKGSHDNGYLIPRNATEVGFTRNGSGCEPAKCYTDTDGMETIQAYECHPSCPIRLLDEQSGIRKSGGMAGKRYEWKQDHGASAPFAREGDLSGRCFADQGGASRYFTQFHPTPDDYAPFYYCGKSSRRERNLGCEGLPASQSFDKNTSKQIAHINHTTGQTTYNEYHPSANQNNHPTVKPQALLSWLSKLICPSGGIILDPFGGSGSQAVACINNGFHFILIEQDASYCEIARARVAHAFGEVTP